MKHKRTILLKVSGELFSCGRRADNPYCDIEFSLQLVQQLAHLAKHCNLGVVVGAGNFFRGSIDGPRLGLNAATSHEIGMLGTIMNGRILQQWCERAGIETKLLSAIPCPTIADPLQQHAVEQALSDGVLMIFAGGSGNPFFTTDTTAVVRALQIGATELWKATKVDGLFDSDPAVNTNALRIERTTYADVLNRQLAIMDATALTLAAANQLTTRVFNLFTPRALCNALEDATFGSTITNTAA